MSEYECRKDGCDSTFKSKGGRGGHESASHNAAFDKYKQKDWLINQYLHKHKSMSKIAEEQGVSTEAIRYQINKHNIQSRGSGNTGIKYAPLRVNHHGYEVWRNIDNNRRGDNYAVHRLLAVAKYGADTVAGKSVHHKNGVPWDNRPENIEVMSQSDHAKIHQKESRYSTLDRRVLANLMIGSKNQAKKLAQANDMSVAYLYEITKPYR